LSGMGSHSRKTFLCPDGFDIVRVSMEDPAPPRH
jgi:hypothetical protein